LLQTVTVGAALCIPLVFIAFNLEKIVNLMRQMYQNVVSLWGESKSILISGVLLPLALIAVGGAAIGPIWTSSLGSGVKTAATACIAVVLALGIALCIFRALMQYARLREKKSWDSSTLSSSSDSEDY